MSGGGVDAARASQSPDERIFGEELARHVKDEVGLNISVSPQSEILTPAILKGGGDWAFPVVVGLCGKPTKGETKFVSPQELQELAKEAEGNRLLTGLGKRMHRLTLRLLSSSPNPEYRREAKDMLKEIEKEMGLK